MENKEIMNAKQIATIQADITYIKKAQDDMTERLRDIYSELKLMRDRYVTKTDFADAKLNADKEHQELATKEEIHDLVKDLAFIRWLLYGAIGAIAGLAYKVFEKLILKNI